MKKPLTVVDLFAGAGGMSLGFRLAGYRPVAAVEYSPESARTYAHNHKKLGDLPAIFVDDIWNPDLLEQVRKDLWARGVRKPTVLTAGLPCETFSVAQRKRSADDRRNFLYTRVLDFAKTLKPKLVLIENVVQLRSAWEGSIFNSIKEGLTQLGYGVTYWVLNAADYGVPQNRVRLFIVALYGTVPSRLPLQPPKRTEVVSISEALSDLPVITPGCHTPEMHQYPSVTKVGSYGWLMRQQMAECSGVPIPQHITNHRAQMHHQAIIDRFALIRPEENLKSVVANPEVPNHLKTKVGYCRHRRPSANEPSYTVTAHVADELLHPVLNRILTPREAARIQSFPDWYEFLGPRSGHHGNARTQDWYEQIGDAVPPLLARSIAEHLKPFVQKLLR